MKFIINAASVSEIGQRQNQEDSVYPQLGKVTDQDRLFILCDGMGGHESGEVASSTVCTAMGEYLSERCDAEGAFRKVDFDYALSVAFDALDALDNGAAKKMGTTMTFLKFHSEGCMAAHIGDSRIYHIRPSESGEDRIRYVSRDHSLINDLVAAGEMTPEQALHSNQKNVITRAMLPGLDPRPKADIAIIGDIQPGDYFYMCSDGMLERMDDMELADIMAGEGTVEDKLQIIVGRTAENRDNHTAHLIEIVDVLGVVKPVATVHKKHSRGMLIALAAAVVAPIVGFFVFGRSDESAPAAAQAPTAPEVSEAAPASLTAPALVPETPTGVDEAINKKNTNTNQSGDQFTQTDPKDPEETNRTANSGDTAEPDTRQVQTSATLDGGGAAVESEKPKIYFEKNTLTANNVSLEFKVGCSKSEVTSELYKAVTGESLGRDIFTEDEIKGFIDSLNSVCKTQFAEILLGQDNNSVETYKKYKLKLKLN